MTCCSSSQTKFTSGVLFCFLLWDGLRWPSDWFRPLGLDILLTSGPDHWSWMLCLELWNINVPWLKSKPKSVKRSCLHPNHEEILLPCIMNHRSRPTRSMLGCQKGSRPRLERLQWGNFPARWYKLQMTAFRQHYGDTSVKGMRGTWKVLFIYHGTYESICPGEKCVKSQYRAYYSVWPHSERKGS